MGRLLNAPASEVEKAVREELEGSLKRLQTDYVDVYLCPYQANSPKEAAFPALQEVLEKFKKEGKIRFTGLSTHNDYANICMAAIDGGYYDVIMFPVNFATLLPHIRKAVLESKKAGEGGKKRGGQERPIIDVREVLKAAQQKKRGRRSHERRPGGVSPARSSAISSKANSPKTQNSAFISLPIASCWISPR